MHSRKSFLKKFMIGAVSVPVILEACKKTDTTTNTGNGSGTGNGTGSCSATPSETEGPFPTHQPSGYLRSDIVDGRTGIPLSVTIKITNRNNSCAALAGAIADIWHCDKDGNYSEYGGSGMQSTNYTSYHFLRGRQVSDANGQVVFNSIFPGWYSGRATHIHVHVYNAGGTSLLVTQIAFPEGSNSAVAAVNNSGSAYGYTKGMTGYTYNANDNVFSDGASLELATVSGSKSAGYALNHTIVVSA